MARKTNTNSISMSPELRAKAFARASSLGLPISRYVQQLILQDLGKGGPFTIMPRISDEALKLYQNMRDRTDPLKLGAELTAAEAAATYKPAPPRENNNKKPLDKQ